MTASSPTSSTLGETDRQRLARLREILEEEAGEAASRFLEDLPAEEVARTVDQLSDDEREQLLTLLPPGEAAVLVDQLSDPYAAGILDDLPPSTAAAIMDAMDSDDLADMLTSMDEGSVAAILDAMDPEDAAEARRMAGFDPETAGGIMQSEYIAYPAETSVEHVIHDLRANHEAYANYDVQQLFVVDDDGKLIGSVKFRDTVLAPGHMRVRDLIRESRLHPPTLSPDADVRSMDAFFERVQSPVAPVVDDEHRLIGVIREEAVEELRGEQAERAILRLGGILSGEEYRSMPTSLRSLQRLQYLVPTVGLNLVSISVIAAFERTIDQVVALAVFLPLVVGLCGSAGQQSVAVSMRELSLGLARPDDVWRVGVRELWVGLINGLAIGALLAGAVWVWGTLAGWSNPPMLAAVIGGAIPMTMSVAVVVGGGVPLLLKARGIDPAMGSGPIITTFIDLFGFFCVLGLATLVLSQLVG